MLIIFFIHKIQVFIMFLSAICFVAVGNLCGNIGIFLTYFILQLYLDLANSEKALQYLDKVLVIDGR